MIHCISELKNKLADIFDIEVKVRIFNNEVDCSLHLTELECGKISDNESVEISFSLAVNCSCNSLYPFYLTDKLRRVTYQDSGFSWFSSEKIITVAGSNNIIARMQGKYTYQLQEITKTNTKLKNINVEVYEENGK